MMDRQKIYRTVQDVLERLVTGDYPGLENLSRGRRLTAKAIQCAVEAYPHKLALPALTEIVKLVSIVQVQGHVGRFSVWVDLWTADEGRSDLQLRLTLVDGGRDLCDVEIDDVLVP